MKSVRFEFGTRSKPIPALAGSKWEELRPQWKQVHGVNVCEVISDRQECGEVDALWTRLSGTPIAVVTADCVPILLYHQAEQGVDAVAAIHAGWRGVYQQILRKFFEALPAEFSRPARWQAVIGPSIRSCCYEVSEELVADFKEKFPKINPGELEPSVRKLNLTGIVKSELADLGIKLVHQSTECTLCSTENEEKKYFSFRGGDRNSRQYSVISF